MAEADDNNPNPEQPAPAQTARLRDQQFRDLYSNSSFTTIGPFDITLTFAKLSDLGGQMALVDQASVTMSPHHFKAFCRSVNETLTAYENSFGALTISDDDTKPTRNAGQIEAILAAAKAKRLESREAASASGPTEKKRPSKRSRGAAH